MIDRVHVDRVNLLGGHRYRWRVVTCTLAAAEEPPRAASRRGRAAGSAVGANYELFLVCVLRDALKDRWDAVTPAGTPLSP